MVQSARLYAISDSGTLVYIPGKAPYLGSGRTLVWVDRNGKEEPLAAQPDYYVSPRISPDGAEVALSFGPRTDSSIRICHLSSGILTRLTLNAGWHNAPTWTPDGKRIVYFSNRESEVPGIYWKSADGTGNAEKLGSAPDRQWIPRSFSGDGKTLVIEDRSKDLLQVNIAALSMEGSHASRPLLANALQPKISPDGRWMAYKYSETGQGEIYVCPFPDVGRGRWQVSMGGGDNPLWSPSGHELFYLSGDAIMAVSVKTDPSFSIAAAPTVLFRGTYIIPVDIDGTPWDISPDGKRFLMIKEPRAAAGTEWKPAKDQHSSNWIDELNSACR